MSPPLMVANLKQLFYGKFLNLTNIFLNKHFLKALNFIKIMKLGIKSSIGKSTFEVLLYLCSPTATTGPNN